MFEHQLNSLLITKEKIHTHFFNVLITLQNREKNKLVNIGSEMPKIRDAIPHTESAESCAKARFIAS